MKREYISASALLKNGDNKVFSRVVYEVCAITDWISDDYPDHIKHFYSKYVPGIFSGEREMIACYADGGIVAAAILKKDTEESKISTFYVEPRYRRQGIATELIEKCFDWLGTTKPLITIAEYKLGQFSKIIKKYEWMETQVLGVGYYNDRSREFVFNGKIN